MEIATAGRVAVEMLPPAENTSEVIPLSSHCGSAEAKMIVDTDCTGTGYLTGGDSNCMDLMMQVLVVVLFGRKDYGCYWV